VSVRLERRKRTTTTLNIKQQQQPQQPENAFFGRRPPSQSVSHPPPQPQPTSENGVKTHQQQQLPRNTATRDFEKRQFLSCKLFTHQEVDIALILHATVHKTLFTMFWTTFGVTEKPYHTGLRTNIYPERPFIIPSLYTGLADC
jgi:hypothetical protein